MQSRELSPLPCNRERCQRGPSQSPCRSVQGLSWPLLRWDPESGNDISVVQLQTPGPDPRYNSSHVKGAVIHHPGFNPLVAAWRTGRLSAFRATDFEGLRIARIQLVMFLKPSRKG